MNTQRWNKRVSHEHAAAPTLSTHLNLFVSTTDPRRYLPRAATEAALLWLERRVYGERAAATLIQTGKIERFPVVAMGTEFWSRALGSLRETMLAEGTVTTGEIETFRTDSPEEAVAHIDAVVRAR